MGTANSGSFVPGDPRINRGGRPKRQEWLRGKGGQALKKADEIMMNGEVKPELQLQAAKMLAEYDLGKGRQAPETDADADAKTDALERMSLSARAEAMRRAIEAYENGCAE